MKRITFALILLSYISLPAGEAYVDDFSAAKKEGRLTQRGAWIFADNVASCTSDPELYKKHANHGPIIRWSQPFTGGTIQFSMRIKGNQRTVFTLNGDGHVFRVILMEEGPKNASRVLAWATKASKTNKGNTFKPEGLPTTGAIDGEWVDLSLVVKKGKAILDLGEMHAEIEHAALARKKKEITLSFVSGSIDIRDFRFTPAE